MKMFARALLLSLALFASALVGMADPAFAIPEPDRLWLVGERGFQDGLTALSRQSLERLIDRFPSDPRVPDATLLLGKVRLSGGDLSAALEAFRKAGAMTPPPGKPDEARFWEGETLFRLKRFGEARVLFEGVTGDPASPMMGDALYGLGWTELEQKHPEAAARAFSRLIESVPDHANVPAARIQLARADIALKKFDDAAAAVTGFAQKYPDHRLVPEARYLLGYARVAGGHAEGIADLRAFVAEYPGHELAPQARRLVAEGPARGGRKSDKGDKGETMEQYRALMAASPRTAEALYDAGTIATRLGRSREAEAAWKELRSSFPDHPLARRAQLEQAQVAFDRGVFKDAAALARGASASKEAGIRPRALLLLGESELKLKHWGPAHEAFRAAVESAGGDDNIRYRALAGSGLAMEEQQRWAEAARYYQQVEASPDKDLRAWARARRAAVTSKQEPARGGPKPAGKPAARSAPESTR